MTAHDFKTLSSYELVLLPVIEPEVGHYVRCLILSFEAEISVAQPARKCMAFDSGHYMWRD
jgi:hypothetical protein